MILSALASCAIFHARPPVASVRCFQCTHDIQMARGVRVASFHYPWADEERVANSRRLVTMEVRNLVYCLARPGGRLYQMFWRSYRQRQLSTRARSRIISYKAMKSTVYGCWPRLCISSLSVFDMAFLIEQCYVDSCTITGDLSGYCL